MSHIIRSSTKIGHEETRILKIVGAYSISIGEVKPEDCIKCHNAKWGTILIDDVCLDCFKGQT